MVRNFTTALVAALVLGSAGIASARPAWETTVVFAPSMEHSGGGPIRRARSGIAICRAGPANNQYRAYQLLEELL
jgi:hypothetical protein